MNISNIKFTPRIRAGLIITGLVSFSIVGLTIFRAGVRSGEQAAAAEYSRAEIENMKIVSAKIAESNAAADRAETHRQNELKLSAENFLLKQQTEAAAKISAETDDKIRARATTNLNKTVQEKEKKINEIKNDDNFDDALCGLCSDIHLGDGDKSAESGKLTFCGSCPPR